MPNITRQGSFQVGDNPTGASEGKRYAVKMDLFFQTARRGFTLDIFPILDYT
jgi:hypothetical protein